MKLSTEFIKLRLRMKHPDINVKTLKRISKHKNTSLQTVRVFSSNLGDIYVTSDMPDEKIVDISIDVNKSSSKDLKSGKKKLKNYYFSVGEKIVHDKFMKVDYFDVAIVPKDVWEEEGCLCDQPLDIETVLEQITIESPNETSSFQAFNHPDRDSLIQTLLDMGMEYNNDISRFLNDNGNDNCSDMYIRP